VKVFPSAGPLMALVKLGQLGGYCMVAILFDIYKPTGVNGQWQDYIWDQIT